MKQDKASIPGAIVALRNDHRHAMRLIELLMERLECLQRPASEDIGLTHDIFRYMVDFIDSRHHAREDRIIDRLLVRDSRLRRAIVQIGLAHDELRIEGEDLMRALASMREQRVVRGMTLVQRLASYAAALATHFDSEERELFTPAAQLLDAEDWQAIDAAGVGEDPLFGTQVGEEYERLFEAYIGRVMEIGTPPRVPGPRAAAVWVDSTAAVIDGARMTASTLVTGSKRTLRATLAGFGVMAQSRSVLEFAAAAAAWRSGTIGETKGTMRRLKRVARKMTSSTLDPVNSAFSGNARQFAVSHRVDQRPPSWQAHVINLGLRAVMKRAVSGAYSPEALQSVRAPRSRIERMLTSLGSDVKVTRFNVGGGEAEAFEIEGIEPERTVLHIPGGGFIMHAMQAHRLMAARLARQARARVVLVHYRLAPENPFPAGLDDCVAAYRHLLESGEAKAKNIALLGDSAGGCLALATLLRLRMDGLPQPSSAVLISPVTDLSYSGASRYENRWFDPSLTNDDDNIMAELYVQDTPVEHPLVSPLFGDLSGLAPLLIQVGSVETLLDDSLRVAAKVRAQGGECECEVWHEMPHDWLLFGMLPEAKKAMSHVPAFIERHTAERVSGAAMPHPSIRFPEPRLRPRREPARAGRRAA